MAKPDSSWSWSRESSPSRDGDESATPGGGAPLVEVVASPFLAGGKLQPTPPTPSGPVGSAISGGSLEWVRAAPPALSARHIKHDEAKSPAFERHLPSSGLAALSPLPPSAYGPAASARASMTARGPDRSALSGAAASAAAVAAGSLHRSSTGGSDRSGFAVPRLSLYDPAAAAAESARLSRQAAGGATSTTRGTASAGASGGGIGDEDEDGSGAVNTSTASWTVPPPSTGGSSSTGASVGGRGGGGGGGGGGGHPTSSPLGTDASPTHRAVSSTGTGSGHMFYYYSSDASESSRSSRATLTRRIRTGSSCLSDAEGSRGGGRSTTIRVASNSFTGSDPEGDAPSGSSAARGVGGAGAGGRRIAVVASGRSGRAPSLGVGGASVGTSAIGVESSSSSATSPSSAAAAASSSSMLASGMVGGGPHGTEAHTAAPAAGSAAWPPLHRAAASSGGGVGGAGAHPSAAAFASGVARPPQYLTPLPPAASAGEAHTHRDSTTTTSSSSGSGADESRPAFSYSGYGGGGGGYAGIAAGLPVPQLLLLQQQGVAAGGQPSSTARGRPLGVAMAMPPLGPPPPAAGGALGAPFGQPPMPQHQQQQQQQPHFLTGMPLAAVDELRAVSRASSLGSAGHRASGAVGFSTASATTGRSDLHSRASRASASGQQFHHYHHSYGYDDDAPPLGTGVGVGTAMGSLDIEGGGTGSGGGSSVLPSRASSTSSGGISGGGGSGGAAVAGSVPMHSMGGGAALGGALAHAGALLQQHRQQQPHLSRGDGDAPRSSGTGSSSSTHGGGAWYDDDDGEDAGPPANLFDAGGGKARASASASGGLHYPGKGHSRSASPVDGAVGSRGQAAAGAAGGGGGDGAWAAAGGMPWLDRLDRRGGWWRWALPGVLFLLAIATRCYRLDKPAAVVFDETHFGRFTGQYLAGTYLFDIHPPLGKLVFWAVARVTGYDHTACSFVNIGEDFGPGCKFMVLRVTAALFGAATIPLMYWIARNMGASVRGGLLAALVFNFEGLHLGESRLILMDSQLLFWCAAALLGAQTWWKRLNVHADAEVSFTARYGRVFDPWDASHVATNRACLMSVREHYAWLVAIGVLCGNAVSVKWTGLATPGMIAIESFFAFFYLRRPLKLLDGVVIGATALAVYAWYFWVHFALLTRAGDGDGFMRIEFQRTLVGNPYYDPTATKPPFLLSFIQLNREMLSANARITQRHHWDSVWWEWPLNLRGVLYYGKDVGHTYTESVYLLGNPLISWMVLGALGVTLLVLGVYFRFRRFGALSPEYAAFDRWVPLFTSLTFALIAYASNMLPYTAVTRSCFIYHYCPALMYGILVLALLVDGLAGRRFMPLAFNVIMGAVIVVFLHFSPWIYAFALTNDGHQRRRWYHRWD